MSSMLGIAAILTIAVLCWCSVCSMARVLELQLAASDFPSSELTALQTLYDATGGTHWDWDEGAPGVPWNFSVSDPDPCSDNWQGVGCECGAQCNVIHLNLSTHRLTGQIPLGLSNLTMLQNLSLGFNFIHGALPEDFCQLPQLEHLFLGFNNLQGPIPPCLGDLPKLVALDLPSNILNGTIPVELFQLSNLQVLSLANNFLFGTIPNEITNLRNLTSLFLGANRLNGSLPAALSTLTNLRFLDVSLNNLHGTIPAALGNLVSLFQLELTGNLFEGTIPPELGNLTRLEQLLLGNNFLNGSIPTTIRDNLILNNVELSGNGLVGTIPDSLCSNTGLSRLFLINNFLTGSLPSCISSWQDLGALAVSHNFLSGNISSLKAMHQLYNIELAHNIFSGEFPAASWPLLSSVSVSKNFLSGTVSDSIAQFARLLRFFELALNVFTGTIPDSLGNHPTLNYISVRYNEITGTIPAGFVNNTQMTIIFLERNFLYGSLPYGFSSLPTFAEIDASRNLLSGTLPSDFSRIADLQVIFLEYNFLSGMLDNIVNTTLQRITDISISQNRFSGTLPASIFVSASLATFSAAVNCFHGSLPPQICSAVNLTTLVLDGLSSAPRCRKYIFPALPYLDAFVLTETVSGKIPECIFSLPKLRSLHLSANQFTGSLPGNYSESLHVLSAAHNILTGDIPLELQSKSMFSLDLSYNRLGGTLSSSISPPINGSLSLEVNQLSGEIPSSLRNVQNISILNGNIFHCTVDRSQLPVNDPVYNIYLCDSNAVDHPMYAFLVTFGLCLLAFAGGLHFQIQLASNQQFSSPEQLSTSSAYSGALKSSSASSMLCFSLHSAWCEWKRADQTLRCHEIHLPHFASGSHSEGHALDRDCCHSNHSPLEAPPSSPSFSTHASTDGAVKEDFSRSTASASNPSVYSSSSKRLDSLCLLSNHAGLQYVAFLDCIRELARILTFYIVVVLMPLYIYFSNSSNSYVNEYGWQVSAVWLEGKETAVVLAVFFAATFSIPVVYILVRMRRVAALDRRMADWKSPARTAFSTQKLWNLLCLVFILLMNLIVMVTIDCVYVYIVLKYPRFEALLVQVLMAAFKIFWNEIALWSLIPFFKDKLLWRRKKSRSSDHNDSAESSSLPSPPVKIHSFSPSSATETLSPGNTNKEGGDPRQHSQPEKLLAEEHPTDSPSWLPAPSMASIGQPSTLADSKTDPRDIMFVAVNILLNNIVVPLAAIACISSNCFSNALLKAGSITDVYLAYLCSAYRTNFYTGRDECLNYRFAFETLEYDPQFSYSYQCASTISVNYTGVFVFTFLFTGLFIPLGKLAVRCYYRKLVPSNFFFDYLTRRLLPTLKPPCPETMHSSTQIVRKEKITVRCVAYLTIIIVFGAIYPPLAVVGCLAIHSSTYCDQFLLGKFLIEAEEQHLFWYRQQVQVDTMDITKTFYSAAGVTLPFSCIIFGYFVFDMMGYSDGWASGVALAAMMTSWPFLFRIALSIDRYVRARREKLKSKGVVEGSSAMGLEMNNMESDVDQFRGKQKEQAVRGEAQQVVHEEDKGVSVVDNPLRSSCPSGGAALIQSTNSGTTACPSVPAASDIDVLREGDDTPGANPS